MLALIGIVAVTTGAVADHTWKKRSLQSANLSSWYCNHQGVQCDRTKPETIEDRWNSRELAYKLADVVLLLVAGGAVIAVRARR